MLNERDFMDYNNYLRKQAKIDPKFAIKQLCCISDKQIKKCKEIMKEINIKNVEISKCNNYSTKNSLNREKGRLLESLAKLVLESTDLFIIHPNIRDHTNEIDLLITPSDYNKIHSIVLPQYLREDILVECKNYDKKIDVNWVGKFSSLINTHMVKMGIIFSYKEFAGNSEWQSSKGLSKKFFSRKESNNKY